MILAALLACTGPTPIGPSPCSEASEDLGYLACVHDVPDSASWADISVLSSAIDRSAESKYLFPATEDAALPTLLVNTNAFELHRDLLTTAWPDLFPDLTDDAYAAMVTDPDLRQYFSGEVFAMADDAFGFIIWDFPGQPETMPAYDDVLAIHTDLSQRLPTDHLVFVPFSSQQRDAAELWNAPFEVYGGDDVVYEAYTPGEGIGTVRLMSVSELVAATEAADFGYQDILVLDEAPLDVERVISGAITGSRQGELSHLNVRSAARGTPNCYLRDAHEQLAEWEGQRVRLTCSSNHWDITPATQAEAEAWWDAIRPDPVDVPAIDAEATALVDLLEVPTDTASQRATSLSRYGAKGSNLAALHQRLDPDLTLTGFVIPFAWYERFMAEGTWMVDLGGGEAEYSFSQTITAWLSDPDFLTDGLVRRQRLEALQSAMKDTEPDAILRWMLSAKIASIWGNSTTMVRFRSSSNAEDSLTFSGAGLYESESACAADEWDDDSDGPSLCDPDKDNEESLSEALTDVWASLWGVAAYEERDWYGIDHGAVSMAVLVNTRSKDEQANIVAFTGSPTSEDSRHIINAQLGELAVVSAESGVIPEKSLLTVEGGVVVDIERITASSETAGDGVVLPDVCLERIGEVLAGLQADWPIDSDVPTGHTVLLDTEWKVLSDGRLVIKQIRPFVR